MKTYVQFYNKKMVEMCGSDSIFILDGRNTPTTWAKDAEKRAWYLRKVQGNIEYYAVIKGERIANDNEILFFRKLDKSKWDEYQTLSDWD